ncbi:MAG: universal stress protein [Cyclobacteriaceae bacterium]|nr:universal stress protein [Cyclobacteriaceae bacterium]
MVFKKTLLYPFNINTPYFEGYAWAMELALRMKARLQLFTTTEVAPGITTTPDSIYHSLLEAQGYFLEHYQHSGIKSNVAALEPNIVKGNLKDELISHLRKKSVDIVIIDPFFLSTHFREITEIEKQSKGLIILPEHKEPSSEKSHPPGTDHFYDVLRRAELYKLPENFFNTLGNDLSVFNYLRRFFQKK